MNLILIAVISLGAIALVLAAILYVASKKFAVYEDPRIAQVGEVLPQANCGAKSCAIAASLYGGETGCSYGCLGCGDCVAACQFDAIHMNPETGLPEVDEAKCTACGACVKACPKAIIEIRPQGKKSRRVYISCVNKDKGAVARKACTVSCIGCGKCVKTCPFEAITLENNLAYIDPNKCKSCRKCVEVCPQNTIIELNFPPRKPKAEEAPKTVAAEAPKVTE